MKFRLFLVAILIFMDIMFLPLALQLPGYIASQGLEPGFNTWVNTISNYPFSGIVCLFQDVRLQILWYWAQLAVFGLAVAIIFYGHRRRWKHGTGDAPPTAGSGEHGTARWRTQKETARTITIWYPPVGKGVKK